MFHGLLKCSLNYVTTENRKRFRKHDLNTNKTFIYKNIKSFVYQTNKILGTKRKITSILGKVNFYFWLLNTFLIYFSGKIRSARYKLKRQ